jgi:hypothetical protein
MRFNMRKLFIAIVLAAAAATAFWASRADAGCGPGCHMSIYGACVVDGWGTVRNECPAPSRPMPPCPFGTTWKRGACQPSN